jgi:hypothetical protein
VGVGRGVGGGVGGGVVAGGGVVGGAPVLLVGGVGDGVCSKRLQTEGSLLHAIQPATAQQGAVAFGMQKPSYEY